MVSNFNVKLSYIVKYYIVLYLFHELIFLFFTYNTEITGQKSSRLNFVKHDDQKKEILVLNGTHGQIYIYVVKCPDAV